MTRQSPLKRKTILDEAVTNLLSDMEEKQKLAQLPRRERQKKLREQNKIASRKSSA